MVSFAEFIDELLYISADISSGDSGLSVVIIVVIVLVCLIMVTVVVIVIIYLVRQKKSKVFFKVSLELRTLLY